MLIGVLYCALLSIVTGSVFSHTLSFPSEKPPEWEEPVIISQKFFSPHLARHPPHHLPQDEFKEIIGIELQRIPFHGTSEHEILQHERRQEHEILEHGEHETLNHGRMPHVHGFLKPHLVPEVIEEEHGEHKIISQKFPLSGSMEYEHEQEHEHHSRKFHNVLKHEDSELAQKEYERKDHEIMAHEQPRDYEILENEYHEHDNSAHQFPYELHHPLLEDPDFVSSEKKHHHENEHEFHYEELFPEVSKRRMNGRREGNSKQSNSDSSRRENSNTRGNSNRRENSNNQGINNRESSRRNRDGSNINTEELFPRRNRQNNNRRNNNNNRINNNREGLRRNSNIEELSALEEGTLFNPKASGPEISRPERDVSSYFNNERRTFISESLQPKQNVSNFQSQVYSIGQNSNRPTNNNFEPKKFSDQEGFATQRRVGKHSENENSRKFSEQLFDESRQQAPTFSILNSQKYSNSGFFSSSNVKNYTNLDSRTRKPNLPSRNIFIQEEEYLTLDGSNLQESSSRPAGSAYNSDSNINNNTAQNWSTHLELTESSRPSQSNAFSPDLPGGFSNGGSSKPVYLGSQPGSGKPLLAGSLPNPENSKPNRPGSSSSGLHLYEEEKPKRPSTGSSGLHLPQEQRPSRPNSSFSGYLSNHENSNPSRPTDSHYSSQEHNFHEGSSRPHRPSSRPAEENSRPRPTNGNNLTNANDLISVQEDSWLWPNQSEDEDEKTRRADSASNKKPPRITKRPTPPGNSNKKQHANINLLPTDSCGVDLGNKIIGGEKAQIDEFPWMALLQHSSAEGRVLGFGCGGSLISPRYILTAAHCIKGPAIGNNIRVTKVRLGEFDISSDVDCQGEICSPPPVDIPVEEIIVHPKYRATDRAQLNDIALIRLRESVKASAYISPICLPLHGSKDYSGEKLTVAGWGKTSNGQNGVSSKTKQKVLIPVVTLEECSPFYNKINIQLNSTQMCAGGERGKDSCQGDSGGPLMNSEVIDSQIRWQVQGIVSFGPEDCGIDNVAGVYTKVSEYIDWILDNMK